MDCGGWNFQGLPTMRCADFTSWPHVRSQTFRPDFFSFSPKSQRKPLESSRYEKNPEVCCYSPKSWNADSKASNVSRPLKDGSYEIPIRFVHTEANPNCHCNECRTKPQLNWNTREEIKQNSTCIPEPMCVAKQVKHENSSESEIHVVNLPKRERRDQNDEDVLPTKNVEQAYCSSTGMVLSQPPYEKDNGGSTLLATDFTQANIQKCVTCHHRQSPEDNIQGMDNTNAMDKVSENVEGSASVDSNQPSAEDMDTNQEGSCDKIPEKIIFQKLAAIDIVLKDVQLLTEKVNCITGPEMTKEYRYCEEMLTKCLLRLDDILTEGMEEVRNARKNVVQQINESLQLLESKVSKT